MRIMKGLLIKDMYTILKARLWLFIPIIIILGIAAIGTDINKSLVWVGLYLYPFYGSLITNSLIRMDKSSKWIIYAKSLPIKPLHTVLSKYIAGTLIMIGSSVLTAAVSFMIWGFSAHIIFYLIMLFAVWMILTAVDMPIVCGMLDRHANTLGIVLKFALISIFTNITVTIMGTESLYTAANLILFFSAAFILFVISIPVSAWTYARKEF